MTQADALIGGKYRTLRRLGCGAMGEVWAAVNLDTDREVALKLITSPDPDYRRRLLREARAIGRLNHPNIVQILDRGETDAGEPFLVMQLLQGETLEARLRRVGALPEPVAAGIALDVARALRIAHEKEIVHRDLKPANIYLHREPDTEEDVVKVVDFGVSKLVVDNEGGATLAGGIVGSPAYMSPEQIRSSGVDGRTDVWSLGVMLFEMLAAERPFAGEQPVVVLTQILAQPVPRVETAAPHVSRALGDVIARCLERDLDARIGSAEELVKALRPFAARGRLATIEEASARAPMASVTPEPSSYAVLPADDDADDVPTREAEAATAVFSPARLGVVLQQVREAPPSSHPGQAVALDSAPPSPAPITPSPAVAPEPAPPAYAPPPVEADVATAPLLQAAPEMALRKIGHGTLRMMPGPEPPQASSPLGSTPLVEEDAKTLELTPGGARAAVMALADRRRAYGTTLPLTSSTTPLTGPFPPGATASPASSDEPSRLPLVLLGISAGVLMAVLAMLIITLRDQSARGRAPAAAASHAPIHAASAAPSASSPKAAASAP